MISSPVTAQFAAEQFVVDRLTIADGLPVNHTNALLQTQTGYLWIASFGGLVRYDGSRFVTFSAGNTSDMPSDRITMVFPGPGDTFWFVTERFDLIMSVPGRFVHVGQFRGAIWAIVTDADSVAWIGSDEGLFRYQIGFGNTEASLTRVADPALNGIVARQVLRDKSGTLWVTDAMRKNTFLYQTTSGWRAVASANADHAMFEDRDGGLWAGGRFLHQIQRTGVKQMDLPGLPQDAPGFYIGSVAQDLNGDLLLFTNYGPFRVVRGHAELQIEGAPSLQENVENNHNAFAQCPDGRLWTHFDGTVYSNGVAVTQIEQRILHLVCDREGNLWVAGEGGLYRFKRASVLNFGAEEGLGISRAVSVYQDRAGGILVSADNTDRYARLYEGRVTVSVHAALASPFYQDREGNLWHGVFRCAARDAAADGSCTRFENQLQGTGGAWVRALHEDRFGTLWAGMLSGLAWWRDGQWTRADLEPRLKNVTVRHIVESRAGVLYMATAGHGVAYKTLTPDPAVGPLSFLTTDEGLSSDNVRGLLEDLDGGIWIATEDRGLNHFDPASGRTTIVRQKDGLYSDGLHQVLADDFGRFWMSTNQGIFFVRADELRAFVAGEAQQVTSIFYRERDGMRVREANGGWQNSALKARDGRLWFATQAGVAVIDPADVDRDLTPPVLVIEELEAGTSSVHLEGVKEIRLGADQRTFRVAYTAINFSAPARMRFRYQLEGYQDDPIEAGSRREATFTKVPSGHYALKVWASNGDGIWNASPAALSLVVAPFLYETWVFRIVLILLVIGLVSIYLAYRTRSHVKRRKELEAEVMDRTEALRIEKQRTEEQGLQLQKLDRIKTRFFTDVSHEFRTPLTLTIGPLEDLKAGPELPAYIREGVDLALANSRRILRLINQLLDVARLEAGEMHLAASQQDIASFVAGVSQQFTKLLERKGVYFELAIPPGPVFAYFDPEKLEQIVINLLSNAFKFTPEGGAIHVGVSMVPHPLPGTVRITVRDTGMGIAPDVLPHVFDRFYQVDEGLGSPQGSSGIGLSLVHDLVELHHGSVTVDSTPRFGSTFIVTLPLGRDHLSDDQVMNIASRSYTGSPFLEVSEEESTVPEELEDADDRYTVLIADDSPDIRSYVRGHLKERYRVLEAGNGREALDCVRTATPDLVISDVMMPEMDGLALLSAMKADPNAAFIPIIMLTARATEDDLCIALELGADGYLTKPFSVRELQLRIDSLINAGQRLRRRYADSEMERPRPSTPLVVTGGISAADTAFLAKVNTTIAEKMSEESFDVQQLASTLRVSRNTLHRRLRPLLNLSPSEYLRQARLERATTLLAAHEWNVSEVAYAVGFKSVSYFSQCFRETYGTTPSGYAAAHSLKSTP